ncbi:hypothetical protein KCU73_g15621, partial [Aureobasidium melanogenum]
KYVTDVTTTYLTTCPAVSSYVTGGVTKTTTYMTVSTATSVIKVSKTGSVQIPATSAPEAPKPTTITKYSTTELTVSCKECASGSQVVTSSYPVVVVSTPASSPVSPVTNSAPGSSGKVTVIVPVTQYTTTCPYTTIDEHGSTSVFLTTSVVSTIAPSAPAESQPASSPVAPAQSSEAASSPAAPVVQSSQPASSPVSSPAAPAQSSPVQSAPVQSTKPVESAPAQSTKPVESAPAQSTKPVESAPAQSTKPVESAPAQSQPASSPIESAPATTPAASSSAKPTGNVVTQISDGQIQAPGPSSAPVAPASSGSAASSVHSVLSSS